MGIYEVTVKGNVSTYMTFVHAQGVCELAKKLNLRQKTYKHETVVEVRLVKDYDDSGGIMVLTDAEFQRQKFMETLEERLVARALTRKLNVNTAEQTVSF